MKKTILAALLASSFLATTLPFASQNVQATELSFAHIETIGTSQVVISADMAELIVEVNTQADTPANAKSASDQAVAGFIARLKQAGINRDNIQSANLSLHPRHQYDPETRTNNEVGYNASRKVVVTLDDLNILNEVLDTALEQGINRIIDISYKSSKEAELIEQARALAIKDAQQKAKSLAKGFGEKIDGVWEIRYFDQHNVQPVMYKRNAAAQGDVGESYQQAQTTISDRVEVIFRLK
ncbi:oxidative stress defense protein [Shewanella colwelliana]|uniref:oxidative stress defense protein n=1 Tax=Shewanella colwelliana TaxID=23 RepID=UPI003736A698